jgi:hypothetical protein
LTVAVRLATAVVNGVRVFVTGERGGVVELVTVTMTMTAVTVTMTAVTVASGGDGGSRNDGETSGVFDWDSGVRETQLRGGSREP